MAPTGFVNIPKIPELRKRLIFTILMLGIYRIGSFITTPGVDVGVYKKIMAATSGTLFGLFNMFSGGALQNASIFALGIMPYISASIIFSLLGIVVPQIERLQKEGEAGRRKINQYSRYATVLISAVQAFGMSIFLQNLTSETGEMVVNNPGIGFTLLTMVTLTSGTIFIMWLGEQITERGIGNGISLVIFAGIVAGLPDAMYQTYSYFVKEILKPVPLLFLVFLMVLVIGVIVFFERGQRRIPVQYAKRIVGRRMYGGQATHLPLKVNTSGVIPPIFASSLLMFPATLSTFAKIPFVRDIQNVLNPGEWIYNVIYVGLIIFFCYFYTAVVFNPVDVADNLKRWGGYIPGIRPGKKTAEYIDRVLSRITLGGALYVSAICVLPTILIAKFNVPFYFGGTALLIVVGVALDTVQQIESHLISSHYEGFLGSKGARIRGRRG